MDVAVRVAVRVLGVDPGLDGGLCLRDGDEVVWCGAWTRVVGAIRLRSSSDATERRFGSLCVLGAYVASWVRPVDIVVVEGLFAPPRWSKRASGADFAKLAEATGEILGPLRELGPVVRPLAREWRDSIGAAKLDADRAEDVAIGIARRGGWLPRWAVAEQGAVAEAGAMAAWGARGR